MNTATLNTKFKSLYDVDITTNDNQVYLNQAIKRISEEYPKICLDCVKSVAGQNRYLISKDNIIRITKVYYDQKHYKNVSSVTVDDTYTGLILHNEYSNMRKFCDIYENKIYEKLNPVDAQILGFNEFELLPAPEYSDVNIYYEYEAYRTLEEIPDIFEDVMFDLFSFYSRECQYRKTIAQNNGNSFYFDRRGMGTNKMLTDGQYKDVRADEIKNIIRNLRNIVNKIG